MGSLDDKTKVDVGDIVAFTGDVSHTAGTFCLNRGITGRIVRQESGLYVLDMGLSYEIYARPENLKCVAAKHEIPEPIDVG